MSTRLWRYEVDEVWGWDDAKAPVSVGTVLIDKWKNNRTWNVYHLQNMTLQGGWHCKLLGEAEPEVVEKVNANRADRVANRSVVERETVT